MDDPLSAFRLDGRVAAVTGAASGIGQAIAVTLAAAGANVVVADVQGCDETLRAIGEAGGKAVEQATDVSRREQVEALADRALSEFGRLDVMCNVAGIASDGPISDAAEEDVEKILAVNLKGTLWGCQAALRVMVPQRSGNIVNVSSTVIDAPAPNYGLYAMTKAAVAMLTRTLAVEHGRHGIRVNAIAPGMTVTPFTARHAYEPDGTINRERYDAFVEQMRRLSPLKIVGEPMDQAYLVLYLVSDAAKFCTGQVWRANGGQAFPW